MLLIRKVDMKSLKIYSSKERLPKHGESIWLFSADGTWHDSQSVESITIECSWLELDPETKKWNGTSYPYRLKKKPNANLELILQGDNGMELLQPFLYAKATDMNKIHGGKGWRTLK